MIIIRPNQVTFSGAVWAGVERVAIERSANRLIKEWSESGPYPTLIDVPEQLVRVRIIQSVDQTQMAAPRPGDLGQLRVELSAGADEGRRLVRIDAVVDSVGYDLTQSKATRTVTLIAQSAQGDEDPVLVTVPA